MSAGGLPPVPGEAHDPEDRVAALERGLAAVVERIEALEAGDAVLVYDDSQIAPEDLAWWAGPKVPFFNGRAEQQPLYVLPGARSERLFTPEQYDDLTRRLQAVRGNAEKDRVYAEWVAEISA